MLAAVVVTLLALLACAPCPSFAELSVDAPDADTRAVIGAAVADFAAWTGREGVCVPSVEVVPSLDPDGEIAGRYTGAGEPILLAAPGRSRSVLFHELCHALDAEEGLSADGTDAPGLDPAAYPTPELRRAEVFARLCEGGPGEVSFAEALADRCGTPTEPELARIRAEVYPDAPPDPVVTVGDTFGREALDGLDGRALVEVGGADGGAWLRFEDGASAWWSPEGGRPQVPDAWSARGDRAARDDGVAVWGWYAEGIAGMGVGTDEGWTLGTDCGTAASGGIPAWVGETPGLFVSAGGLARLR